MMHVSLRTPDLDACVDFYTALFGAGPDKRHADYARFTTDDIVLALMPGEGGSGGVDHFGLRFATAGETQAEWKRAEAAGLTLAVEGEVTCCWARSVKAWATDPDGRMWELYTVLEDANEFGDRTAMGVDSACCAESEAASEAEDSAPCCVPAERETSCCG